MTVTDVQPVPGHRNRHVVVLDERLRIEVSLDVLVNLSLFKGESVDQGVIGEIARMEEDLRARQIALNFLAPRMRSVREVTRCLSQHGIGDAAVDRTLSFLTEYGMLDDEAFASAFIHDRLLRKAVGPGRLAFELRRRGIHSHQVENALESIDGETERRLCLKAARGHLRSLRPGSREKREHALSMFLAQRGFGWEAIRFVIGAYREDAELP